jgi:hypothetical protein
MPRTCYPKIILRLETAAHTATRSATRGSHRSRLPRIPELLPLLPTLNYIDKLHLLISAPGGTTELLPGVDTSDPPNWDTCWHSEAGHHRVSASSSANDSLVATSAMHNWQIPDLLTASHFPAGATASELFAATVDTPQRQRSHYHVLRLAIARARHAHNKQRTGESYNIDPTRQWYPEQDINDDASIHLTLPSLTADTFG